MYKTHLGNQLLCKLQPQQDDQDNVGCLQHKSNQCKLGSSIEIRGRMTSNTGSTLPMAANLQSQLKKKTFENYKLAKLGDAMASHLKLSLTHPTH